MEVQRVTALVQELKNRAQTARGEGRVVVAVGYATNYAIHVHENIEMKWAGLPRKKPSKGNYWGPSGQAKFLEMPARRLSRDGVLGQIIATAMSNGATLSEALILAGQRIQRDSQALVPVDTGTLKNSAFTVKEQG